MQSALQGVRVIDFGHVLAGPWCTMQLASLGAEVIKIETRVRPDEQRAQHGHGAADGLEGNSNFFEINLGKKSASINLVTEEGKALAKKLVATADIVLENMRPGVMKKLGLDYDDLVKVKPDIIMLSLSGFGATGDLKRYAAYNPCFTSVGGTSHLTGYGEKKPNIMTNSGGDARAGTAAVFAALVALKFRQETGKGQYIDSSSSEVIWTADKGAVEAMHILQAEGVAATPSFRASDLFSDPHVLERGQVQEVDHPVLGTRTTITSPYRLSETPVRIRGTAPILGQDNDYVFRALLGLADDEYRRLADARVIY